MRFSRLVQLNQVCGTLIEAADYIQTCCEETLCEELLQNGIQLLDQFHDLLYQARSDWKTDKPAEYLDKVRCAWHLPLADNLNGLVMQLRRALQEDIAIQVKAVFFAELGGKWDSMDSVYQFMRKDPRFDPVVVLTPIFRAKQVNDKTKTELIYNDYLTEMGIPFLNYWEYSPDQDCPELAFTSQPYESVTIPEFWAENIAKYTRLVYLPYFIPGLFNVANQNTLCNMPIHTYSWRVAGSSEKFAYYYRKHSARKGENLLLTGIPKMDYAVKLKKKPSKVPLIWQNKIEGRVVLLWNTWYDGHASSIDLLEELLPWFQEHQQFSLIWRPHPMSGAVMKLHQPEQYHKFQKIMNTVAVSDNMIFDDGADYGPAFSCSSAQISDYSGMMIQYLLLNKPLLWIQKAEKSLVSQAMERNSSWLVSNHWMERASTPAAVIDFIERVARGEDRNRSIRADVCVQDLPLADGNVAERICTRLWEDLYQECLNG